MLHFRGCAIAAVLAGSLLTPLSGALLLPGTTVPINPASDNLTGTDWGTLLASSQSNFAAPTISGVARSAVFRRADNGLDFLYQVTNNDGESLGRITGTSFSGFATDVFFRTDGDSDPGNLFLNGSVRPETADRSQVGAVVGFNFPACVTQGCTVPPQGKIGPGESSYVVVVRTNATEYFPSEMGIVNGTATSAPAFAPVPEPGTYAMMACGLLAIGLYRRKTAA